MFDPEDFAKLGQRLVQNPCGAADSRTAIGRAYYSAFLYARRSLDSHFLWPKTGEAHEQIQILFVNCRDRQLKLIGSKLVDLRRKRNDADYDLNAAGVDYHDARLQLKVAAEIISELKRLFTSNAASGSVIAEMKEIARVSGKVTAK